METQHVLVTGANGFVGRHIVDALLAAGSTVTVAVRDSGTCPRPWHEDSRITIVGTGPLEAATNLDDALRGAGAIVHAAGLAHVTAGEAAAETAFRSANVDSTARLVDAARHHDARTLVHLSSLAAITGNATSTTIDDHTCETPTGAYGRSKLEAENVTRTFGEASGRTAVSLRPPLVIGAAAPGNWRALQRLASTGLPLPFANVRNHRSFVDARELARAVAHLCARDWPPGVSGEYCIASRETLALRDVVAELRKGMGMSARLVPFPPRLIYSLARIAKRERLAAGLLGDLRVDAGRFKDVFGFAETGDLRQAIRDSGRGYARKMISNKQEATA